MDPTYPKPKHGDFCNPWIVTRAFMWCSVVFMSCHDLRTTIMTSLFSDGVLSLQEFSTALASRPIDKIPIEHDLSAIVSGEFVALAFERFGVLSSIKQSMRQEASAKLKLYPFLPSVFSSACCSPPTFVGCSLGVESLIVVPHADAVDVTRN